MYRRQLAVICFAVMALLSSCSNERQSPKCGGIHAQVRKCPYDNARMKRVPIIYGKPGKKLMEQAGRGEIILGGCIVNDNSPEETYICPICKRQEM